MSDSFTDVSVVMATRNEELAIAKTIQDIQKVTNYEAEIVIVDGSTDNTSYIAEKMGVHVIKQKPQGYGIAVKAALLSATKNIIVTLDCDDTYPTESIPEFVRLIMEGYDVVSGSRIVRDSRSMSRFNRFGNIIFAKLTSWLYGISITDVTTGMRAYRKEVINSINWTENVGLSAELIFRPAIRKYKIIEIPIDYRVRVGETKLNPICGGMGILKSILKYRVYRDHFSGNKRVD
jgi:glycosyltransferase involved in cell wall biosynthesis